MAVTNGGGGSGGQWSGGTMQPEQIAQVAYNAGFRGDDLVTAVAVALAESSGDPSVNSQFPGEDSRGLWQINEVHFGWADPNRLYNPQYNAEIAYELYSNAGGSFNDWTTYSGRTEGGAANPHTDHLPEAQQAVAEVTGEQHIVAASAGGGVEHAGAPSGGAMLQRGTSGSAVKRLQQSLASTGHYDGAIDGIFGPKTEAAVEAFQRDNGLSVDGIYGPNTAAALNGSSGGSGGGSGGGGGGADFQDNEFSQSAREVAYQTYGGMAEYFLQHDELGPILQQAAAEGWDSHRLRGAVSQTSWWQSTNKASRAWEALKVTDPAQAEQRLNVKRTAVLRAAERLGLDIDRGRAEQMAERAIKMNWTETDLARSLGREAEYQPGQDLSQQGGTIGTSVSAIKQRAKDFAVPVSDRWAYDKAVDMATGRMSNEEVDQYFRRMAISRFPHLEEQIEAGVTVREYTEPYVQQYAKLMERPAADVDLVENRHLSRMLDHVDSEGKRRSMSLSEAGDYLRSTDEWHKTDNAKAQYAEMARSIGKFFGRTF